MEEYWDTIYCDECEQDIPVEELQNGSVIVHCPRCIGECLSCECYLVAACFPNRPRVTVIHPDESSSLSGNEEGKG